MINAERARQAQKLQADMHTHSESSHDSVCKIEDMCLAELAAGTTVMAVTDHFDTYSYRDYDIFTPIRRAHETVDLLGEKYRGRVRLLKGIEISEGFWHPEQLKHALALSDYDVIVGSVHCVKYGETELPYSKIDFGAVDSDFIHGFLGAYFDDVMKLIETTDFDVLAHLDCPLRYINGKYRRRVDLGDFSEKIDAILRRIISEGKALEVNTSSYHMLNDFMPGLDIIKRYYELGGRLITLGSDAHTPSGASANFAAATAALRNIGFELLYYYEKRTPVPYIF